MNQDNSNNDDDNGEEELRNTGDQFSYRAFVMRELDSIRRDMSAIRRGYVTKEVFEANVKPVQRIMWMIFSVVSGALILGVLGLLFQSGKVMK